ncbi:nitrate/nitrite sensor protein NarQ [compost metagenome]
MSANLLKIQLKDNGKGFDTNIEKSGRGLNNMQVRAERIKGTLKITSNREGTTITLSIVL